MNDRLNDQTLNPNVGCKYCDIRFYVIQISMTRLIYFPT